ncbi:MAG TPA: carboxypeptidase regulatory-like domain-containing protein [Pyrinomonadaceae bacterium]|nr:carboxypeptidase regulatory-like domain-containing protein [Pyrinomonadaceae bacterium]
MKKHSLLAITILTLIIVFHTAKNVSAAELVTNGSFETGTFAGWTAVNVTTNVWFNWSVSAATNNANVSSWTNGTSPRTGTFSAWNGWAAGNPVPAAYRLRQDITIPNNPNENIVFRWYDRLQWDLVSFSTTTLPQYRIVNILNPANNAVLQEIHRFTAPAASQGPMLLPAGQGWTPYNFNLNAYKGQTIRLEFQCTIAQNTAGPGYCEFDDISVQNLPILAAEVPIGGRITTANGNGIRNVAVSLTESGGNVRTVRTNAFGYYNFEQIEVGQNVTLTINSKRYTFTNPTRIISVTEELSDVDWTAIE